jgi:hypothetical protein
MADISEAFRAKYLFVIIFWPKLINSFSPKGLARLAEGFNPALKIGEVIYPSLLS